MIGNRGKRLHREVWLPHLPPALPRKGGGTIARGECGPGVSGGDHFQMSGGFWWWGGEWGNPESQTKWHTWGQSLLFKDAEEGAL